MLYVKVKRALGKIVSATIVSSTDPEAQDARREAESRNQWNTMEAAEEVAKALGAEYVATDAGKWTHPRYDVVRVPQIGDEVSYSFNGDTYPCGKITKVSKTFNRIEADGGENKAPRAFYRRGKTGSWVSDGTWYLVGGHVSEQNPSF